MVLAEALLLGVTSVTTEHVRGIVRKISKIHDGERALDLDLRQLESTARLEEENTTTSKLQVVKHAKRRLTTVNKFQQKQTL